MATKHKFRMATNPITGELEWAPATPGTGQSLVGWVVLAVSTLLFLLIAAYFAYAFLLSSPRLSIQNLPGGGDTAMRHEVQHLRGTDQQR
jgi:hypothetical protein